MKISRLFLLFSLSLSLSFSPTVFSAPKEKKPDKPTPPTRAFDAPGAPKFTRFDGKPGVNPPVDANGDFVIGPDYVAAPEANAVDGVPQGRVQQFQIDSKDCKLFNPGIARDVFGTVDPNNPKTLIVETHPIDYKRTISVYVPAQYVSGTAAPFIVAHDGPGMGKPDLNLARVLDNLIAQKRVPSMIAISISSGGGDAQGHERGREYDTLSGLYAEFIENEVLPLVEKNINVKLTKDPEGRATMGNSSGGSAALIMAWYHPELYHRVLTFSGTFVNQQWPFNPETPDGAWGFHNKLIPESPVKPLRIWMAVGDRDNSPSSRLPASTAPCSCAYTLAPSSAQRYGYTSAPASTAALTAVVNRSTSTITTTSASGARARSPLGPQSNRNSKPSCRRCAAGVPAASATNGPSAGSGRAAGGPPA